MGETFVVIGAGIAGVRAAAALRAEGFDGRLVLVGAEPHLPYDRPPLSKELLRGTESPADICLHPEAFYDAAAIELRLGAEVARLLPGERQVVLATGDTLPADKVLLCTGGVPRRLDVPGSDLGGVHYLRSLDDALAIRDGLTDGARVVVVGAGWIGAEVAASARQVGCEVTIVEIASTPLARVLGDDVGRVYAQLHRERGVDLRTGVGVVRIEGHERVGAIVTSDERSIPADLVVVGVGMQPVTRLAEESGIAVDGGILVDVFGGTSIAGTFASGDVVSRLDARTGRRVRVEHWQSAQRHAVATAKSMLGQRQPFAEVPWFWSDQYAVNLQLVGDPLAADSRVVIRGDLEDLDCTAFYLRGEKLVAALGLNRPRDVRAATDLIAGGSPVDRKTLADPDIDLRALAKRTLSGRSESAG